MRRFSENGPVRYCYEASGAGFVLQRVCPETASTATSSWSTWSIWKPGWALDADLELAARSEPFRTRVEALMCLRGVKALTALTLRAEIDDIRRFRSPGGLMPYFGLVPSEGSFGERGRRGPITKAGNTHARRLLVEAPWNNRHRPAPQLILNRCRLRQSPQIVAIALKVQHRLAKKFHRLDQGNHRHVAITAVARELCGFVWTIFRALPAEVNISNA